MEDEAGYLHWTLFCVVPRVGFKYACASGCSHLYARMLKADIHPSSVPQYHGRRHGHTLNLSNQGT